MAAAKPREKRVRTTVSLPKPVYEEARAFVGKNANSAQTISSFFVTAIVSYVKLLKRKQIDAQFAAMAGDTDYQKQAKLISEEFSQSDWEAFASIQKDA
jgi:hypothetical protein